MHIRKQTREIDEFQWICKKGRVDCSKKSLRDKSFFSKRKLSTNNILAILYMWAYDYDNRHIACELQLNKDDVVNYIAYIRIAAEYYCDHQPLIGGEGKIIEMDESAFSRPKHHRGAPKGGHSRWMFGGVERGEGGRGFAIRVDRRCMEDLYPQIRARIHPGTMLLSDEYPTYIRLRSHLPEYQHLMIRHKKKTGGGFAKWVKVPCPRIIGHYTWLRVHTNKCEGMWELMKHKIKRIRGTSEAHLQGYISEAILRMNSNAMKMNVFRHLIGVINSMVFE